ncbi:hypothetical protein I315_05538 [Cryptococcus gattii Ru294]|uniref:Uncharacterized protein n=2 Tax=Cryptococcus gattii TaxID=37769 RepID=E6R8W3_CRYGW|nr:Hypothetical Protein CGB_G0370C [Cryptococcus gattii WM276]KIR51901.1 hypothetical protein I315_05538 [Cryptococcus gattii Ru294]KIR77830.1 hypothetical protein I306_05065 [Cryptococcus gattii EJB2]KIY31913.1 hypothetical protein I305_05548 [Cryptococcus gattii E566]KJE03179.1 hypothetical protein I311_02999 [Cryptococcus gattii NT-10]ADV23279.1 Hypothetical Protein CGB_G0370C [Cryptococcus gattii WM276]
MSKKGTQKANSSSPIYSSYKPWKSS